MVATASVQAKDLPRSWQRTDPGAWSQAEAHGFLEDALPGHPAIHRLGHMDGKVLSTLAKDELRRQIRDEEAANVIWAELARSRRAHHQREDISAHGSDPYKLYIRTPMHASHEIEASRTETVADVKARLAALEGTAVDAQRLVWNGVPMIDSRTLGSYGIYPGSVLLLVPRLTPRMQRTTPAFSRGSGAVAATVASIATNTVAAPLVPAPSGILKPRVPVVCNDILRPFPMSIEFPSIPEYQSFMLSLQKSTGPKDVPAEPLFACGDNMVPLLEILPADDTRAPVQTRILFDKRSEVLVIDTVGDMLMEYTKYQVLLHLRDDQKPAHLVTGAFER